MKKNVFFVAAIIFLCGNAYSQGVSFGVKAGLNIANVKYSDTGGSTSPNALLGFHGGVYLTAMFTEHLGLQPEILYSGEGFKSSILSSDYKLNLNYINIPVLVRYNVNDLLSFHAGPQFGILSSAKAKAGSNSADVKDDYKSTNLGIAFGGTVDLPMGLNFTLRYVAGLSNIDDSGSSGKLKTGNFQASVGYKLFGSK